MAYSAGGLIQATDYNGFVSTTSGASVNNVWSTGSTDSGWGQGALATVGAAGTITATQWASLVNTITSMGAHTGTTITARSAPVAGNTINILAALNTDLTNITANRQNAVATGTQFTGWTGTSSKITATGSGNATWTITFTHTITWASANAARYFFNAGGRIKWETSKTSIGTAADDEWNDQANTLNGDIYITGGTTTQIIAGSSYTGTTKVGGTGSPSVLATTVGWFDLTTVDLEIYKQFADTYGYTSNFININAKTAGAGTQLIVTTRWVAPTDSLFPNNDISGGTVTNGVSFGTAPATVITYFPPSTNYLSASWGNPTVSVTTA
jgi:hypothetical protein